MMTLDQILDGVMELPEDQQDMLVNIMQQRRVVTVQSPLPLTKGRGLGRGGQSLNPLPSPPAPLPQAGEGSERLRQGYELSQQTLRDQRYGFTTPD